MQRIGSFDILKGICITIVVLCHTITFGGISNSFLRVFLQAIFLNCFFFVAGWFTCQNPEQNFKTKIFTLGIPYLILSVISIVFNSLFNLIFGSRFLDTDYKGIKLLFRDIYVTLSLNGIGTLWFLPILIISSIILLYFIKFFKNKILFYYLAIILFVVGFLITDNIYFNYSGFLGEILNKEIQFLNRIFTALIFGFLGYLFNLKLKDSNILKWIYPFTLIAGIIIAKYNFILGSILIVCSITLIFYFLNNKKINSFFKILTFCGKNSIMIMYLHYIIVLPFVKMFFTLFNVKQSLGPQVISLLLFLVTFIVTVILSYLISKNNRLSFIFGKGKDFIKFKNNFMNSEN